jgi:FKBP-type peptidyl-prolyl cis-trans isomerase SlyD
MPRVISFHYTLKDKTGLTLDSSQAKPPLTYMEGAEMIIDGLEKRMLDMNKGDKRKIVVPAAEAYGLKGPENRHPLAGKELTFDVEVVTVREATAEELAHGHPHEGDGHGH